MNRLSRSASLSSVLVLASVLLSACPSGGEFESARQRLLDMAAAAEAANKAFAEGDREQARAHQERAQQLLHDARDIYERNGAAQADDPRVLVGYGDVLRQLGDFDLAAEMYAKATGAIPDDPTLWLNLAKSYAALGEHSFADAQQALERCIALEPEDRVRAEAYSELAGIYRRMGLYDFSAENLRKVLELRPNDSSARMFLAAHWARRGKVVEASEILDGISRMTQDVAVRMPEILGSAMADFERYRHVFPDEAAHHLAYAKLLIRLERTQEALPALERSVELDGSDYVAWNLLGSIARQAGNTERAREAFERSLELNPDQPRTEEALRELSMTDETPEIRFEDQVAPPR